MALLRVELPGCGLIGLAIPALLVLAAVVLVIVIAIQRSNKPGAEKGDGSDIIAYLVLTVSMIVAGFALAELANTAFPGDRFVFDPADDLATSLAALVVSTPFLIYFWRRQADRRDLYPAANGWTLYLSFIELVFMTAFVVSAVTFVNGLISDEPASAWASAVVFGLIIVFHELATGRTPPLSEAGELPRVIGSAIGLITAAGGLFGSLAEVFATLFGVGDVGWHPWLAMAIVGLPVWAYRWLRPWPSPRESVPRLAWTTAVTVGAMAVAVGSATSLLVLGLQYVVGDTQPAGSHFEPAPIALGLLFPSILIAIVHRRALGAERNTQIRFVDYAMAAIGLVTAVTAAIALTVVAFDRSLIVGGGVEDVILFATVMVVGLAQWWVFTRRTARGDEESEKTSWPRRIYHLGLGVGFGLVSAGALITTLVIVLRRLMVGETEGSLLTPLTIFIYTALATWYLLSAYARDRATMEREEMVAPFDVTIITSHPGMIAAKFPKQARLQVLHRGDDAGAIDDEMADAIVAAVANQPSLVWVDADGFRVAPRRHP